jgi:hypothetical protein
MGAGRLDGESDVGGSSGVSSRKREKGCEIWLKPMCGSSQLW